MTTMALKGSTGTGRRTDKAIDAFDLIFQRQTTDVVLEGIGNPPILHPDKIYVD